MNELLPQVGVFLGLTGGLLTILLGYVFIKSGSTIQGFKDAWIASEGSKKPIWKGIGFILGLPILIGVLLFGFNKALHGAELKWFQQSSVFVGIDYTLRTSPFCTDIGSSDRLTSNMGFKQQIVTDGTFSISGKYTHHSCVIGYDSITGYDAPGIVIEWVIK